MVKSFLQFAICVLLLLSCNPSSTEEGDDTISENLVITPSPKIIQIKKPLVTLLDTCPPAPTLDVSSTPKVQILNYLGLKIPLKLGAPVTSNVMHFSWVTNYKVEQGLASNSISCAFKDKIGNIWFGTLGQGVSRFDGKNFTNFNVENGLTDNRVSSILEDNNGNIWIGTKNGVSCYNGYYFKNYDTAQGLPNALVTCLTKDKNGKLWVGTNGGICYYDGINSFVPFSKNKQLPSLFVSCLLIDRNGKLWSGGTEGACSFDGEHFSILTKKQGLIDNIVTCFAEDKSGAIWMGTYTGVSRYDGHNFSNFSTNESPGNQLIYCITQGRDGRMWFGTRGYGLYLYNEQSSELTKAITVQLTQTGDAPALYTNDKNINNHVLSITEDNDGTLWLGTYGNGVTHSAETNKGNCKSMCNLLSNYVHRLSEDHSGNIWFNNYPNGITCYNRNESITDTALASPLKNRSNSTTLPEKENSSITTYDFSALLSHMWAVYVDKKNNIWAGTSFGVMKYDRKRLHLFTKDQGLPLQINVMSIKEDRYENMWFCTRDAGLIRYNEHSGNSNTSKVTGSFEFFNTRNGFIDNYVPVCAEDKNGNLWFGSSKGLCYYHPDPSTNHLPQFTYFTIADGLPNNNVHSITADQSGNLWFGTDYGLSRYDGHSFLNFSIEQGLVDNHVSSVACNHERTIWLGTDKGLSKLSFKRRKGEGNQDTVNLTSIKADTTLCNELLARWYKPVFENYNWKNGYPISDVKENSLFVDSKNILWIGTGERLIQFNDNGLFEKTDTPKLQLQGIKINNEKISWNSLLQHRILLGHQSYNRASMLICINDEKMTYGYTLNKRTREAFHSKFSDLQFSSVSPFYSLPQNLVLPFKYNNITFEYAGIKLANADKIHYQYMLEGPDSDKDWQEMTIQTTASFNNLFEGDYIFKLRAKTGYGLWGQPVLFSFKVLPPWYRVWWAYIIYVFVFVSLIWLIVRWRTKKLNKDKLYLETIVKERTTEALTQKEEAEKQRKIAEQSARAKENFLSNMSHEIRTPLNAISGYTGLSLEYNLPEHIKKNLHAVKLSSDHLKQMVDDILDFSKLESGQFSFEEIDFDLEQVIHELKSMLKLKAMERHNAVYSHISKEIPKLLYGDKKRLIQVLINLTDNAIKFTDNGRIDISVDLIAIENENLNIRFTVKDTGIGIPDEKLDTIFESFTQADNTIARKFGGTGLGLTISKKIVELQGGKIEVNSSEQKGSSFSFNLYFRKGKQQITPVEVPFLLNHSTKNIRILAAEDDPLNRDLLGQLLTKWNISYDFAESGIKLLALLKKNTYDLILVDIHMPDLNGFDVVGMIRNGFPAPVRNIPIIALTADVLPTTKERIMEVGINDYLYKPVDAQLLFNKINQTIAFETEVYITYHKPFNVYTNGTYFKPDYLFQNYGDSEAHFLRLLNKSKLKLEEYIYSLTTAHQEGDHEKMLLFSHRLQGIARILGIETIPGHLLLIDQFIHQKQPAECIEEHLSIIQHEANMASQEIHVFLQSFLAKEIKTQ